MVALLGVEHGQVVQGHRHIRVVVPEEQATHSVNSPFRGRELSGCVIATWLRGRATVMDGSACDESVVVSS